jgi:phosphatidylinositol alpha 1,6-mannosyltransferase
VRVAFVAESFHPTVNGVSNSVQQAASHLRRTGHQSLVIAPEPGPDTYDGIPVERVRSFRLPLDRGVPVGLPRGGLTAMLAAFGPDVVHLVSPTVLGWSGALAARKLNIPAVAVFQTDLAGFARRHHLGPLAHAAWVWQRRVHALAEVTLVPSTWAAWQLRAHGFDRLALWRRGVDQQAFSPWHRSAALRRDLAPRGELIVGYVGRLAREKQVHQLQVLAGLPGIRVVVVGDGPRRARLERSLSGAAFLGFQRGRALSEVVASLDVFVHTGIDETFCQSIQEALASGVPVLAPARGGPLDLVHHDDNGWLWPAGEPGVLREQVRALAEDPARLTTMRLRARASVLGCTWEQIGDELIGHYRQAIRSDRDVMAA